MVLRIFIRRLLIIILLVILLSSLALRVANFVKEQLLVERGSIKIYFQQDEPPAEIKDLEHFKNKVTYGVEKRNATQIEYYNLIRNIQSEDFYDVKNKLEVADLPLTVLKDNGIVAELQIGENYEEKKHAQEIASIIYQKTKINFNVTSKSETLKYEIKYIKIDNLSMAQADKIAEPLRSRYEIKWLFNTD